MARILTVGIAAVDIINEVAAYPAEDTETRALAQSMRRGGNAANTAVVLAQLGHAAAFCGVLVDEPDLPVVTEDLDRYGVDWTPCRRLAGGKLPTSYITVSRATGSRTIVHHRDLPELDAAHFRGLDIAHYDWIHFEGRNVTETAEMIGAVRRAAPGAGISVEIEKPREAIETLYPLADALIFSRDFALQTGATEPEAFLRARRSDTAAPLLLPWGADGAWGLDGNTVHHAPGEPVTVVETLGAGDTFNAGAVDGLARGRPLAQLLADANRLAAAKCARTGFDLRDA